MPKISNKRLIEALRCCTENKDCRRCYFHGSLSSDCIGRMTAAAADRIEELQKKSRGKKEG